MSYVFERVLTETFEVEIVQRNFMKYEVFSRIRKDIRQCGFCSKPFAANDTMNLTFIKQKKNELVCDDCATKAIAGGATESIRTKSEKDGTK